MDYNCKDEECHIDYPVKLADERDVPNRHYNSVKVVEAATYKTSQVEDKNTECSSVSTNEHRPGVSVEDFQPLASKSVDEILGKCQLLMASKSDTVRVGVGYHADVMLHYQPDTNKTEVEVPERIERILHHLNSVGLLDKCNRISSECDMEASDVDLLRVHSSKHVNFINHIDFHSSLWSSDLPCDLYISSGTPKPHD